MDSREPPEVMGSPPAPPSRLPRWLREPLLHFLLAGTALFAGYQALNPASPGSESSAQIRLTEDELRQMTQAWIAQGRPPPTPEQMAGLVEMRVREEIFYREALALGLDKNDTIVRRRLAQKMEFLAEDLSGIAEPSRDELKAWFEGNAARFAAAPRASFRHLYFSPDRRGTHAGNDAGRALEKVRGETRDSPEAARLADPFMFQEAYADRSFDQLASDFGQTFAQSLFALDPGSWQGPIESGYGWHLVWIDSLESKRTPAFEEVAPEVRQTWIAERRAEQKKKIYEAIRARYEVIVPGIPAVASLGPGERP